MPRNIVEKSPSSAFTIVELLVVVAIIGTLIALLLPAIQAARESGREQVCRNNLRQLAIAALNHVAAHGHLPTGGWGASWTGDPDRGFTERQPGGWTYNLLPFLEQQALHDASSGLADSRKQSVAATVMQQPVDLFHCPTRRPTRLYPHAWPYNAFNVDSTEAVARCDYAINAGDRGFNTIASGDTGGPRTLDEGDNQFAWPSTKDFTGVSFLRSSVRLQQISDGTSHTYLFGEKSLAVGHYESGLVESDRGHVFIGFAPDTVRLTRDFLPPRQDSEINDSRRFGSAHVAHCFFAFCDGSVRAIEYDIDRDVHRQYGNREDGN
jgi:type II secretory pathway pseudopilin PulG